MIVITRHTVADTEAEDFPARVAVALEALSRRPGYRSGRLARAVDDPGTWTVVTEWDGAGFYRRALSDFDVRLAAVPLLSTARDEASAFEVVAEWAPGDGPGRADEAGGP